MLRLLGFLCLGLVMSNVMGEDAKKGDEASLLSFKMKSLEGKDVDLKEFEGKVIVAVNVASKCGYTPQYEDLQALHEKYADKGLVILGFPCNQFGRQEPGSADDIASFCEKNYGVTFAMFEKVEVNGDGACDLYKALTAADTKPVGKGKVSWNFEKFVIGRDGKVVGRFKSGTNPMSDEFVEVVEKQLAAK